MESSTSRLADDRTSKMTKRVDMRISFGVSLLDKEIHFFVVIDYCSFLLQKKEEAWKKMIIYYDLFIFASFATSTKVSPPCFLQTWTAKNKSKTPFFLARSLKNGVFRASFFPLSIYIRNYYLFFFHL